MTTLADPAARQAVVWRSIGFALTWLVIAGPTPASWLLGLPTVALATWASLKLASPLPYRVSLRGLLSFLAFFMHGSLLGGWDVAMRTMARRMRIAPDQIHYTSSLPEGLPIVLFSGCVSLMPGTLIARIDGRHLTLHLLDARESQQAQLEQMENLIAGMLGIHRETSHV